MHCSPHHRRFTSHFLSFLAAFPGETQQASADSQFFVESLSIYICLHHGFSYVVCCSEYRVLSQSFVSSFISRRSYRETVSPANTSNNSFQEVQQLSAIQTSVRFIPNVAIGIVLSLVMGQITHRVSAYWIVLSTTLITSASPLLLALNHLDWSYWYALFWGVLLSPISGDGKLLNPSLHTY